MYAAPPTLTEKVACAEIRTVERQMSAFFMTRWAQPELNSRELAARHGATNGTQQNRLIPLSLADQISKPRPAA